MKSIDYPTEIRLNPTGQFNKLCKDESGKWFLLDTTTQQTRQLVTKEVIHAMSQVLTPLLS